MRERRGYAPSIVRPYAELHIAGQSVTVRYTGPAIVLVLASASFLAAIWLAAGALSNGRTGPTLLLAAALAIASFVVAAWAVGKLRRTRAITPEAIISPPDESR
jgi:hypothetical protein